MTNGGDSEDDLEGLYDCSEIRSKGDFRAFVECDDETSWFYFCGVTEGKSKILSAHHILNGPLDFEQEDISVRWNNTESHVGLLIKGKLWAV